MARMKRPNDAQAVEAFRVLIARSKHWSQQLYHKRQRDIAEHLDTTRKTGTAWRYRQFYRPLLELGALATQLNRIILLYYILYQEINEDKEEEE